MKKTVLEIIGWYGTIIIVLAYVFVSFEIIKPTIVYQILNITGAVSLACISVYKKNYQPAVVNIICALFGLIAIIRFLIN